MTKKALLIFILSMFAVLVSAQVFQAANEQGQLIRYKVIDKQKHHVAVIEGKPKYSDSKYTIPEKVTYNSEEYTVKELGKKAFHECINVTELILPNTVETIRNNTMENCPLSYFIFPDSLKTVEENAFSYTKINLHGWKIRNDAGKTYTLPYNQGEYHLYIWNPNLGILMKNETTGHLINRDTLQICLSQYNASINKQFSNPFLKGSYELVDVSIDGSLKFENKEIDRSHIVRRVKEIIDIVEQEANSCFRLVLSSTERVSGGNTSDVVFRELELDSIMEFSFEDEYIAANIRIPWYLTFISYDIQNKTNSSIKLIWDEAAYVDLFGNSTSLLSGQTRLIDSNRSQKSSIIVRNSSINGYMYPQNKIIESSKIWFEPLLPSKDRSIIDKSIAIMLPIVIGDIRYEYNLVYTINFDDNIGRRNP